MTNQQRITMERPTITPEMILEAAQIVAERTQDDAESIAECYDHPMNGYHLAKALEDDAYWDISMDDVEELDNMSRLVEELLSKAEWRWVADNNIEPPLPIGATITQGVIAGFSEYAPARYKVKEPDCTEEGRFLLVKYEDAISL